MTAAAPLGEVTGLRRTSNYFTSDRITSRRPKSPGEAHVHPGLQVLAAVLAARQQGGEAQHEQNTK